MKSADPVRLDDDSRSQPVSLVVVDSSSWNEAIEAAAMQIEAMGHLFMAHEVRKLRR